MLGLMQDWPLLCHRVIDHAALNHAERRVISRSVEGPIHSTTYAAIRARALKVAKRLGEHDHPLMPLVTGMQKRNPVERIGKQVSHRERFGVP